MGRTPAVVSGYQTSCFDPLCATKHDEGVYCLHALTARQHHQRIDVQLRQVSFEVRGEVRHAYQRIRERFEVRRRLVRGRCVGIAVGSAGAQREHGFWHSVDHAQKGAGRTLRHQLTLFPTAHCRDRYTDPARKFSL
jgi:hypothetical protein